MWAAFLFFGIAIVPNTQGASFHIPDGYENPVFRIADAADKQDYTTEATVGGAVAASNNLDSLWQVTDYGRSACLFRGDIAFAQITTSRWSYVRTRNWWLGVGRGWIDSYTGNQDAAQLWLDLHSRVAAKANYLPSARFRRMSLEWVGFGKSFPLRLGGRHGIIDIGVRHLQSEGYEELALEGWISGDQFAGPVSRLYSDSARGSVGRGWCVDAAAELRANTWRARVQVEGLLGRISWDSLTLDSGYLSSPRVFTDAEGFLRDAGGGFTGVTSRRNLAGPINPKVRLSLAGASGRAPLLSATFRKGDKPSISLGVMHSCADGRFRYVSYYPATKMGEVAFANSRLKLRLCSDSWLFQNPKHALAELSLNLP